jgi:hypothetical protein
MWRFAREILAPFRRLLDRYNKVAASPLRTDTTVDGRSFTISFYEEDLSRQDTNYERFTEHAPGSWHEVQEALNDVCELFAKFNLPVESSRIGAYRRCLQKVMQAAEGQWHLNERDDRELLNSIVDLSELKTICSVAAASPDPSVWKSHLRKLASGTHPHVNSKSNAAWNFQYEMFLAAVMQLSGYEITIAEPDVVVKDAARTIGIAAKRPQSLRNLVNNVKKGASQIRNAGFDGLVALDVSLIIGLGVLFASGKANARSAARILVNQFINNHEVEIIRACQGRHVIGCLVTLNVPCVIRSEDGSYSTTTTAVRWTIIDLSKDVVTSEWIHRFAEKCEEGLFGSRAGWGRL